MLRHFATLTLLVLGLLACNRADSEPNRCELCGMRVERNSGWRAGATATDGRTLSFDSPKCMLRYRAQHAGTREPWVIEYYSQQRREASGLHYVVGSDVTGPMGRDFVPIEGRERAEQFLRDHHGQRVLAFAEITAEVIDPLFRPQR